MNTEQLKLAKQAHDQYIEQRLRNAEKRYKRYERLMEHMLQVIDKKADSCEWTLREVRAAVARIRP